MAVSIRQHNLSVEEVIFPVTQRLTSEEHDRASKLLDKIMDRFEPLQASDVVYKPVTLLRLTKEGVLGEDEFLEISIAETLSNLHSFQGWTVEQQHVLEQSLVKFAGYLMDNFFLPLKILAMKTPQPTPASLFGLNLSEPAIGTRQSILRQSCLQRNRHRCVVTQRFDTQEGKTRYKIDRNNVKDDDGNPLMPERNEMAYLEVAHIIPHSLMFLSDIEGDSKPKLVAHEILKIFNYDAAQFIRGTDIDRPMNAPTLTHDLHRLFGNFEFALEPVQDQLNTYKIDYVNANRIF
ncbi:hypothetical protein BDW67DRAFT_185072 [Aspergillus spinulosporus]